MTKYKVELVGGNLIKVVFQGEQTKESLEQAGQDIAEFTQLLRRKKIPILILVKAEGLTRVGTEVRLAASALIKNLRFDRAAVYSKSNFINRVGSLIVRAVGKSKKVRFFVTNKAAQEWLFSGTSLPAVLAASKTASKVEVQRYKTHVRTRINQLQNILAEASIGDLPEEVPIPERQDEFMDLFVGLRLLIESFKERLDQVKATNQIVTEQLNEEAARTGKRRN